MDWFELKVAAVEKETADATSVVFDVPDTIKNMFSWVPGQHVRLQLPVEGQLISRNYSISAPKGQPLKITVKKVKNGQGSNFINASVAVGECFQVTPPMGSFILRPQPDARRSHYFFAAGSGITPIFSMLVSVLEREPDSFVYLLYGNKDANTTIFAKRLDELATQYPHRLVIRHCHSSPGWFSQSPWHSGRIDADTVHRFIRENPPYAQDAQYYLCGPGSFLPDVKRALQAIDVPKSRIHIESFGGHAGGEQTESVAADLKVTLHGQQYSIRVNPGQTLLQAMLANGISAPYSCEGGVCGTCRCSMTEGKADMNNNLILDEEELKRGDILPCQAVALTESITLQYRN